MKQYKRGITFGAFDPVHIGHINIFINAKKYCEKLTVCISDNDYLLEHKGHSERFPLDERVRSLESIKEIDSISVQSLGMTKKKWAEVYGADVVFVGDDWKGRKWDGAELGIPVVYLPRTSGVSSTELVK